MDINARDRGVFSFGRYRLDPVRRVLLRDGARANLSARLFDTLLYLVENHDRLVTHKELEHAVWRDRRVEEGNVGKAVTSLRKALQTGDAAGSSLIVTVAGRGYRFGAPVVFEAALPLADGAERENVRTPQPIPDLSPVVPSSSALPRRRRHGGRRTAALLLVLAAAVAVALRFQPASTASRSSQAPAEGASIFAPPPHSVAVMAFTNLSSDPGQEYFSDGLSEELIDALGRIHELRVPARLSSFSFKGKPATIGTIARQLNVGAVLEGSVRRDGNRVRITAQLIDAVTGYQLWSHSYDRDQTDVLQLQGDIAEAVTDSLRVSLLGDDRTRLTLGGTRNPAAFDAYLRGMKQQNATVEVADHEREALAEYDEAIRLDPAYAAAEVGRASSLLELAIWGSTAVTPSADKQVTEAMAAADRALALAPELGSAHAAKAFALMFLHEFAAADGEYRHALQLMPNDSSLLLSYSDFQAMLGHFARAIESGRQAAALDPLAPKIYIDLAWDLFLARAYDEALVALGHVRQIMPSGSPRALGETGFIELIKGDAGNARRDCDGGRDWLQTECLAMADHALGRLADADAQLTKLRSLLGDNGAYNYAEVYAQWHEPLEAVRWLRTALQLHDTGLTLLRVDPLLDPIRGTPGYKDIEQRMNFPK